MVKGALTALITPFQEDGELDINAFEKLIEWQISNNIHGLVPAGTTGESPTLSHEEHRLIIKRCVEIVQNRVPVIAGTGSNSTREAVALAQYAQDSGADGVLVVTPYYNKPNQQGLIAHYGAIARAITIPVLIYNIPGRSVIDMNEHTMRALQSEYSNIIGVKDATGNLERAVSQRIVCGPDFKQFSGNDCTALAFNAQGGIGCISVTSNVAPKLCSLLQEACAAGDYKQALQINDLLAPLNNALFAEPNPTGVKYAAHLLGLVQSHVRLPMVPLTEQTKCDIKAAMEHAGLL